MIVCLRERSQISKKSGLSEEQLNCGGILCKNFLATLFFPGLVMARRMMVEREPKIFVADHPFVFTLMNDKNLVFFGRVA